MKTDGWDGDESNDITQWTFMGSLFYSIIVITTIGEFFSLYIKPINLFHLLALKALTMKENRITIWLSTRHVSTESRHPFELLNASNGHGHKMNLFC